MRDFSSDHRWLSLNTATVRKQGDLLEIIDACARLEKVQLLVAKTEAQRRSVRQRYVDLLNEIENREKGELDVGRGTVADVAEAHQRRLEAVRGRVSRPR